MMGDYGYCPVCGAHGVSRERRPNGNDVCVNGHTYPSSSEKDAVDLIKDKIQKNPELAWVWQNNIAVCYMDEGGSHRAAHHAAARFMKLCFDVDVTKLNGWKNFESIWAEDAKRREELLSKLTDGWVQC